MALLTPTQQSRLNQSINSGQSPIAPTNINVQPDDSNQTTILQNTNNPINLLGANATQNTNDVPTSSNTTTSILTNSSSQSTTSNGVTFTPTVNPLNVYANYTYHIRWFIMSDADAYNIDESNPNVDNFSKTIIAESGVTATYNIIDFEIKNTVSTNRSTLNTDNISWTMTVVEPFGISLIDKIRAVSKGASTRQNYMRAPTFIDIWFTGYNEDGSIVATKLFYQLYRVNVLDMNVNLSESGSRYDITGIMDGAMGHSNELSFSGALSEITATTVGDFFTKLTAILNSQQKSQQEQNRGLVQYAFNIPPEIVSWPLRNADVLKQNNRNADMSASLINGSMAIKINRGMAVENIVNYVLSMSPNADKWLKGSSNGTVIGGADLQSTGLATWINVHSSTKIIDWDAASRDYIREITFSLVPYKSIKASADLATITKLETQSVQQAKINYLSNSSNRALTRLYQYIYTGENTEVLKFDIKVDGMWNIILPQWEATNTYSNYTVGPELDTTAVGTKKILNQYTKQQSIQNLQNRIQNLDNQLSSNPAIDSVSNSLLEAKGAYQQQLAALTSQPSTSSTSSVLNVLATRATPSSQSSAVTDSATQNKADAYVEDVQLIATTDIDPLQIVVRPDTEPNAQIAEQGGDSNRAKATTSIQILPDGRSFIGSILGNMYNQSGYFVQINLEIRGDPYWMGQGNVRTNNIAKTFGQDNGDLNFANFTVHDNLFVLSFKSGSNYSEDTGLMEFNTTNEFFNGAYGVLTVSNNFKNGSFTQNIEAFKDPFAQKVSGDLTSK